MSKYGPFTISTRERSRLAWRQRVDAAARAWAGTEKCRNYAGCVDWLAGVSDRPIRRRRFLIGPPRYAPHEQADALDAALSAPRPWRSQRKPDPRRRYSRSHRRACKWCRGGMEWLVLARRAESCGLFGLGCFRRDMYRNWRRNPHGRSGR